MKRAAGEDSWKEGLKSKHCLNRSVSTGTERIGKPFGKRGADVIQRSFAQGSQKER